MENKKNKIEDIEKEAKRAAREKRVKMRRIRFWAIIGVLAISVASILTVFVMLEQASEADKTKLIVYCGAGMREPMEDIAEKFEEKHENITIKYTFGGSNTLLSQIELYEEGDVYMPGATSYINTADEKGYIDEQELIAYHIPVIAVPEGNPANIQTLDDLGKSGVKVVFGDPEACAIGKLGKKILQDYGNWEDVEANIESYGATVNELVFWIAQEQGDASIIWKSSLLGTEDNTDVIEILEEDNKIKIIPIGTLSFSEEKKKAEKFINFVASDGKKIFSKHGFEVYEEEASSSSLNCFDQSDIIYSHDTLSLYQNIDYSLYGNYKNIDFGYKC